MENTHTVNPDHQIPFEEWKEEFNVGKLAVRFTSIEGLGKSIEDYQKEFAINQSKKIYKETTQSIIYEDSQRMV